jgi:nicotinamidase-related amidase
MDRLSRDSCVLLLVDVQERLAAAMPPASMDRLVANARLLVESAAAMHIPIVVSEQYPKGLGPTVAPLASRLAELGVVPIDKLVFDASSEPRIARAVSDSRARSIVLLGMETHICVMQTARELVRRGYVTHVVADACASRREENREVGLRLCERAGAFVTSAETVAFDWVERAGTDAFRTVSKLVRE